MKTEKIIRHIIPITEIMEQFKITGSLEKWDLESDNLIIEEGAGE